MNLITDKTHEPNIKEITDYICNPLFEEFISFIDQTYQAKCLLAYSGDNILLGWNIKFEKAGKALCRLYPKNGYITLLIVIGRKEKERVEALLPEMSTELKTIYDNTQEGMGQRWLLIDLTEKNNLYQDVLTLIQIRRESR